MKNREVKFRAWNNKAKKMIYFDNNWQILTDGPLTNLVICSNVSERSFDFDPEEDGESTILMQYTGLKNKRGVPVYEGDILEHKTWGLVIMSFGEYESEDGTVMAFHLIDIEYKEQIYNENFQGYEVVGNIYEHPNLLKPNNEK